MANVKLLLKEEKEIRGKKIKAGTPVFEGECLAGLQPADIEKGIQLGEIRVEIPKTETKKANKEAGK